MGAVEYIKKYSKVIDDKLNKYLPRPSGYAAVLHRAMRYSVFSKGKRIRPVLTIAACQACGGNLRDAIGPACAVELIHTYTLIHDDLPAMDNSDYRRGKLSSHKKFGQANAILAGDALLTLAFKILVDGKPCRNGVQMVKELADYIGYAGTAAGQVVDMATKGRKLDKNLLEYINSRKTGHLIVASLKMGALAGNADKKRLYAIEKFGKGIGLVFQIIDDVLDGEGYAERFGKRNAIKQANALTKRARASLAVFGDKARPLDELAVFLSNRTK